MAAMVTIRRPLTGAIPVLNRGPLPVRPQIGNCKQVTVCSWRGQSGLSGLDNGESDGRVRFVVRASGETGGNGVVSQTPTIPITESEGAVGAENLTVEESTPSPLQDGDAISKEPETLVGGTPTSSIESKTEETNDSSTEESTPSPLQDGETTSKEPEVLVGGTPTSSIESKSEETNDSSSEESTPSPLQDGDATSNEPETLVGGTPTSSIESKTEETNDSSTEQSTPSPLQDGDATSNEPETLVGGTPTSSIESKTEKTNDPTTETRETPVSQNGGTLDGDEASGKPPAATSSEKNATAAPSGSGKFEDPRWSAGTWDITKFTRNGKIDWDAVIDAEVVRRKWLEANPETSNNAEPVVFDTATVPWWAWVKRFHLPEAELLNGRAAMVGYAAGYLVDSATGYGLVDQQSSFLGKLLIFFTVLGVMLIRKNSDVANIRTIIKESTFYDKQWQATWKDDDNNNNNEKAP